MIKINENQDINFELKKLKENITLISDIEYQGNLKSNYTNKVYQLLSNNSLKLLCEDIVNNTYIKDMNYNDICYIYDTLESFFSEMNKIKSKIDIEIFLKSGNRIDIKKLKQKFKLYGKDKEFPNFNFKRLKELIQNPPSELKPMDNHTENLILYDIDVVRKYIYAIIQMVIDEMDLVVLFTGKEGLGKSCACSQDMSLVYYLLKELGLIDYEYDIKEMWFNNVRDFNETEDKYFNNKFRILGLDEGNELNSQDWQNPIVKTFFQRLRRERYNQRIKFISIPQLVELMKGVSITRTNFIFYMESTDDLFTGTLNKGFCSYYILPRNKIYSYYNKKELYASEIQNIITTHLKDKNTGFKKLPNTILIKRYKRNNIWGFDKKTYTENLKDTNKTYSVEKGIRFSDYENFLLFKFMPPLKDWGFDKEKRTLYKQSYLTLNKVQFKIKKVFNENPDKKAKFDNLLAEQLEKNKESL